MNATELTTLKNAADSAVRRSFNSIQITMFDGLTAATKREARAYKGLLDAAGRETGKAGTLTTIAKGAIENQYSHVYPGTDLTGFQRLHLLATETRKRYEALVWATGDEAKKAAGKLRKQLHDPTPGRARVAGGSISKALQRINRSEQSRGMRNAGLAISSKFGAKLVYWRLSAAHRYYGGNEVCEMIAVGTGTGVEGAALRAGLVGADLTGLYLIDSFPHIPHPHCMCVPEPKLS